MIITPQFYIFHFMEKITNFSAVSFSPSAVCVNKGRHRGNWTIILEKDMEVKRLRATLICLNGA